MPELDEFKVFQALLHKFKDFQGLEVLFSNSSTFKFCTNPVTDAAGQFLMNSALTQGYAKRLLNNWL